MKNNWVRLPLNSVAEIIGGGTPKTSNEKYWNGKIPWITPRDLSDKNLKYISKGERYISEIGLSNSSAKLLPKGTVLLSSRAPVGYLAIAKDNLATNQGFRSLIPKKNSYGEFLYYLLKNNVEYLKTQASGSTFLELSGSVLGSLVFNFPPLPEQKAIAGVLSALDDKIDLLQRQNRTLQALAQTLFRQWFIEQAQDDWKIGTLSDVLTVKGGSTPSTKKSEFWDGKINWATPKDLTGNDNPFLLETSRRITESGLKKISSGLLPIGTLLLSSRAPIGYLAISDIPLSINQGFIAILDERGFSKYFLYLWLKENMDYVESFSNGSTFLEISKTSFKKIEISIPPKKLRDEFDKIATLLFQKIKSNLYQIMTLGNLRDLLLPRLISGQVRVRYDQPQ